MSRSAMVAQTDLIKQIPSCSHSTNIISPSDLDVYSWAKIFENVAASVPLRKALEFKTLHSEAYLAVNRVFRKVTKLKIEILSSCQGSPIYTVQDSATSNSATAIKMICFVLENLKCLTHLDLYFEEHNLNVLNQMLEVVIESEHVKLKILRVKRKHAGQTVSKIGELVRKNAETLKEISRIGISEASIGFNDQINLDRFACMSFDLGFQPSPNQIPLHFIRITESGAKFKLLSYTSFCGFDPTDDVVQSMLENCCVQSLKLTMMNNPKIAARPSYMVGKVRNIKKVELVKIVAEPQRVNKLLPCRHIFEKVFPMAEDNINILQQWN